MRKPKAINNFFHENISEIIFINSSILIGVIAGIISFNFLNIINKTEIYSYLSNFISDINNGVSYNFSFLIQNIFNDMVLGIAMIVFSFTFFCTVGILILSFCKGYTLGFVVAALYAVIGPAKASYISFLILVTNNAALIFAITILGVICINFNKEYISKRTKSNGILKTTLLMATKCMIPIIIILGNSFIQTIVFPLLLKLSVKIT